jgi:hypothetical protein
MIDGHEGVFGDGILPHELKGVLVQLLERYLALADYKSKFHELPNDRSNADPRSRSHLDLDARDELPLVLLPVALVDGQENFNLQI